MDNFSTEIQELILEIKRHRSFVSEQQYNNWFIRIMEYGQRQWTAGYEKGFLRIEKSVTCNVCNQKYYDLDDLNAHLYKNKLCNPLKK